jgi:hypothetical protein
MEEVVNPLGQINLIDEDFGVTIKLVLLASNIKREVCCVSKLYLSF